MGTRVVELERWSAAVPTASFDGDVDEVPIWSGHSCELIDSVLPVADLMAELVADYRRAAARVSGG